MGVLGARPWAVSEPGGVIDVFWRDFPGSSLWYASDTPGHGWTGPAQLARGLSSAPSPVVSSSGVARVFWKGAGVGLWEATRDGPGGWGSPTLVGMGPLGGWPHAIAQPGGEIGVFWRHGAVLMGASLAADGHWSGPYSLGRETSESAPVPVSAAGTVHVLFVGGDDGLWQSVRTLAGQWLQPSKLLPPGPLAFHPFAGVGPGQAGVDVFWPGPGQLWWSEVSPSGQASAPRNLG
jgi:hypothetical protein